MICSLLRQDGGAFCALARSCKGSFLGNRDARKRVVGGKYTKYVINTNSQHHRDGVVFRAGIRRLSFSRSKKSN